MKLSTSLTVLAGTSAVFAAPAVVTVTEHVHTAPVVTVQAFIYESKGATYTSFSTAGETQTTSPLASPSGNPTPTKSAVAITDVVESATTNANRLSYFKSKFNNLFAPATTNSSSNSASYVTADFPAASPTDSVQPESSKVATTTVASSTEKAPETTKTTSQATEAVATKESQNSDLSDFASSILAAHNAKRSLHKNTGNLNWSNELADYAQNYADQYDCSGSLTHSGGPYGENLALGYDGASGAVNAWYDEIKDYDFSNPDFTEGTGHFTQLIWKDSTEVGCGIKTCNNEWRDYVICSYKSPGNVGGQYADNVNPLL